MKSYVRFFLEILTTVARLRATGALEYAIAACQMQVRERVGLIEWISSNNVLGYVLARGVKITDAQVGVVDFREQSCRRGCGSKTFHGGRLVLLATLFWGRPPNVDVGRLLERLCLPHCEVLEYHGCVIVWFILC